MAWAVYLVLFRAHECGSSVNLHACLRAYVRVPEMCVCVSAHDSMEWVSLWPPAHARFASASSSLFQWYANVRTRVCTRTVRPACPTLLMRTRDRCFPPPQDFHLAKRFYDMAHDASERSKVGQGDARLPVFLASLMLYAHWGVSIGMCA